MSLLELEPVEHVAGQVPLPLMPDETSLFLPRPVRRPDGRLYRPRTAPAALLLGYDDGFDGVAVMRTHDVGLARRMAMRELFEHDPAARCALHGPELRWGRWRPEAATGGSRWLASADGASGTPAVFFAIEECP